MLQPICVSRQAPLPPPLMMPASSLPPLHPTCAAVPSRWQLAAPCTAAGTAGCVMTPLSATQRPGRRAMRRPAGWRRCGRRCAAGAAAARPPYKLPATLNRCAIDSCPPHSNPSQQLHRQACSDATARDAAEAARNAAEADARQARANCAVALGQLVQEQAAREAAEAGLAELEQESAALALRADDSQQRANRLAAQAASLQRERHQLQHALAAAEGEPLEGDGSAW